MDQDQNPNETPVTPETPPVAPVSETPAPVAPTEPASQQPVAPVSAPAGGSKGMAIAALVLSIVGLVTGLLIFISVPAAIVAIVLAIVVLVKRRPGKGFAIASLIMGGLTLLFAPILLAITAVSYSGITERANTVQGQANASAVVQKAELYNSDQGKYPTSASALTGASSDKAYLLESVPFASSSTEPTTAPRTVGEVKFFSCDEAGVQVEYWDYDAKKWTSDVAGNCETPVYVPTE